MLATIEDVHATDDLKSAQTTEIEQIQAFLTQNDFDRPEALNAIARLQKKLVSLKTKSSIFNNITLSSHVAAMM